MTHGELTRAVTVAISPLGLAWINNTGALRNSDGRLVRYGLAGSADVLACIGGRMIGIECKLGRDKPSSAQLAWGAALTRAGGLYIVARTVDDALDALSLESLI